LITPEFHDQHKALYYEYKKTTSLEENDLQYVIGFGLGGIHLELQARAPFTRSTIRSTSYGEASCYM